VVRIGYIEVANDGRFVLYGKKETGDWTANLYLYNSAGKEMLKIENKFGWSLFAKYSNSNVLHFIADLKFPNIEGNRKVCYMVFDSNFNIVTEYYFSDWPKNSITTAIEINEIANRVLIYRDNDTQTVIFDTKGNYIKTETGWIK